MRHGRDDGGMEQVLIRTGELGDFLRSRRARLTPDDVGAGVVRRPARAGPATRGAGHARRRQRHLLHAPRAGPERERLRLGDRRDQSRAGLDDDERAHLHDLAKPAGRRERRSRRPVRLRPGITTLLGAMDAVPALALDPATDVLAWNPLGHALVAGHVAFDAPDHAGTRPNLTRMLFQDPHTRELYVDWEHEARRAVASLRLVAGRLPRRPWPGRADRRAVHRQPRIRGPLGQAPGAQLHQRHEAARPPDVGRLELGFEVLHLPDNPGVRLLTYAAGEGSAGRHSLHLLARLANETPDGVELHELTVGLFLGHDVAVAISLWSSCCACRSPCS